MSAREEAEAAAFMQAATAMLELSVNPAHVKSVVANVQLLRRHADVVLRFPVPQDEDPNS